jgi:hypothetical protein
MWPTVTSFSSLYITVYADELDQCKQYNNFIPVTDTALFSTAMDRGCYNAAINKISISPDENFFVWWHFKYR